MFTTERVLGIRAVNKRVRKVTWAVSVPRLGFTDNHLCASELAARYGIWPTQFCGAFWGQCLERVLDGMVEGGCDWILTTDYDTVFTLDDFENLFALMDGMEQRQEKADAIAAVQLRRNEHTLLLGAGEDNAIPLAEYLEATLTPCNIAHFGFTMFRAEALKRMPHPWFLNVPGKDGKWGEGKQDEDIYFWRKWKETGNTLFVANHIVTGHIESLITWPDKQMKPVHQTPSDFWKSGKPANVWN